VFGTTGGGTFPEGMDVQEVESVDDREGEVENQSE